ncbi:hypothetical protein CMV_023567 [Castanea mollissima]|uniref:Uncharacterized protein n=1 Tax=Castanea mollissima TaxID=60419 RepID=A0A8J4VJ73_9ROSI|nr:hypothetical protein CMV_023567 [Castanea mollissima]
MASLFLQLIPWIFDNFLMKLLKIFNLNIKCKINRLKQMKTVPWSDVAKFLRLEMKYLRQALQRLIETAEKAKMELSSLT